MFRIFPYRIWRRSAGVALGAVVLAGAGAGCSRAQVLSETLGLSSAIPEELPASGLIEQEGELHLTLDAAVRIALQRNLGLLVQRYDRAQFALQVDENLGIFDTNLDSTLRFSEETSPSASQIDGADVLTREQQIYNVGATQLTPWGGTGEARFNVFRQEDNSIFSTLNPFFFTDLDVSFTQPLLRGFGRGPTYRGIQVAKLNSQISRESLEQQVTATIQQVVNGYFALVEAREQLTVAIESRDLAVELHEQNKVRVEVGTLAPLELVQSEVAIATREEEIIRGQQAVGDAEDTLRQLLNIEEGRLWAVTIVADAAEDPQRVDIDLEAAIHGALEGRPELRSKRLELETLGIEATFWTNQKLPRLDLDATYGYNGLGGDIILRDQDGNVVSTIDGGLGDAIDQLTDRDFDGWVFRLTFAYPIQNRTAKARSARASLDYEQGGVELTRLEQDIRTEVRKTVRSVRSAEQQIDSARASVRLAERNLDAERKKYENGLSTSFQILEIQEDLSQARSRLVSAIATYRRAVVEYYRSTGALLQTANVELVEG